VAFPSQSREYRQLIIYIQLACLSVGIICLANEINGIVRTSARPIDPPDNQYDWYAKDCFHAENSIET
jgi:hypothetical protein